MARRVPKNLQKKRFQISISPAAARMANELAARERRSFSNILEVLIERASAEQKGDK